MCNEHTVRQNRYYTLARIRPMGNEQQKKTRNEKKKKSEMHRCKRIERNVGIDVDYRSMCLCIPTERANNEFVNIQVGQSSLYRVHLSIHLNFSSYYEKRFGYHQMPFVGLFVIY